MMRWQWGVWLVCALVGCGEEGAVGAATGAAAVVTPELTEVTAARTDLVFRYRDAEGAWQTASAIGEVPENARGSVQVVDLSLAPEARAAGRFVQIFDLRTPDAQGHFPGRLVPRETLEEAIAAADEAARPRQVPVTMYSASWCGVCRKARAFLHEQGIAFVEKDIEKDSGAAAELSEKVRRAGIQAGGVPVFDVGGHMQAGFDPQSLLQAARAGTSPTVGGG